MFAKHHLLWIDRLQDVADGKIRRLMGLMPPGSAKSLFTSVVFPTYYLGRFPKSKVIVTGHGSDLLKKFGRWARTVVSSPMYKRIFNCTISDESAAVDEWALTNGSEWYARGILAGITGQRADVVIWDDLMRGREDADSKTMRDKTWDAYTNDLLSRKSSDDACEIGINTRWHEDDPPGRILPPDYNGESGWIRGQDGNDWYVVCLPAICERDDDPLGRDIGDLLWPQVFSMDTYKPHMQDARMWTSLYQQRPSPATGAYFEEQWFCYYGPNEFKKMPHRDTLHIYGASDYATTDQGGNYTVHVLVGVDPQHNIYVLDLWRDRTPAHKWIKALCDMAEPWRPIAGWAEENGQIKAGVGPFLHKELMDRHLYFPRQPFPTKGDKQIRARSFQGKMAAWKNDGADENTPKVYFPRDKFWFHDLRREMLSFPAGKTDDQVDALGLIGQIVDRMMSGSPLSPDPEQPKVLSMNPNECTVTLEDIFHENEKFSDRTRNLRIW